MKPMTMKMMMKKQIIRFYKVNRQYGFIKFSPFKFEQHLKLHLTATISPAPISPAIHTYQ